MYVFVLLSNKQHHILSNFWICYCMHSKLCHLMVIFVILKWDKLLHYDSPYLLDDPRIYFVLIIISLGF